MNDFPEPLPNVAPSFSLSHYPVLLCIWSLVYYLFSLLGMNTPWKQRPCPSSYCCISRHRNVTWHTADTEEVFVSWINERLSSTLNPFQPPTGHLFLEILKLNRVHNSVLSFFPSSTSSSPSIPWWTTPAFTLSPKPETSVYFPLPLSLTGPTPNQLPGWVSLIHFVLIPIHLPSLRPSSSLPGLSQSLQKRVPCFQFSPLPSVLHTATRIIFLKSDNVTPLFRRIAKELQDKA